jgi:hypothetical protein
MSLLHHHLSVIHCRKIKVVRDPENVNELLTSPTSFNIRDSPVLLVELSKEPKNFTWSPYGLIYVRLNSISKSLRDFCRDNKGIDLITVDPELYKYKLQQFKGIFTEDAFEYFWNKFKLIPKRMNAELFLLIQEFKVSKILFTRQFLRLKYESLPLDVFGYLKNVGTPKGSQILRSMDSNSMWTIFMDRGSKPAIIDQNIDNLFLYYLEYVRSFIRSSTHDLRLSLLLFDSWLKEVGVEKDENKYRINPKEKQINLLRNIYE